MNVRPISLTLSICFLVSSYALGQGHGGGSGGGHSPAPASSSSTLSNPAYGSSPTASAARCQS